VFEKIERMSIEIHKIHGYTYADLISFLKKQFFEIRYKKIGSREYLYAKK
jgi:hypothetical protein